MSLKRQMYALSRRHEEKEELCVYNLLSYQIEHDSGTKRELERAEEDVV